MTNLSQPEITNLLGEIRDMERRIRDLERGNALTGAIPQGESLVVLDPDDGSKIGIVGRLPSGLDGAQFSSGGVTTLRVGPDGLERPYQHIQLWSSPYTRVNVTAGAFTVAFRGDATNAQHRVIRTILQVGADVGTSGELRINSPFTSDISAVYSITGAGSTVNKKLDFEYTGTPGGSVSVQIELRRTAGAGNVFVERPIVSFGEGTNIGTWV